MASINLSDISGSYEVSRYSFVGFLNYWFNEGDLIAITNKPRVGRAYTQWGTINEWAEAIEDDKDVETFIYDDKQEMFYDTYFGLNPHTKGLDIRRRGSADNIAKVNGLFADLDVKDGSFSSTDEIIEFLESLEYPPHALVSSGSGGVHAYWKIVPVKPTQHPELYEAWWSYLADKAGSRTIDRLIDITRMLRVPGTVRVPKKDEEDSRVKPVSMIYAKRFDPYTVEEILNVSKEPYSRVEAIRSENRKKNDAVKSRVNSEFFKQLIFDKSPLPDAYMRSQIPGFVPIDPDDAEALERSVKDRSIRMDAALKYPRFSDSPTPSDFLVKVCQFVARKQEQDALIQTIQDKYDWEDILIPHGWKLRRTLRSGEREWARPGSNDRSATTDWVDPKNPEYGPSGAMSLLSSSLETGLSDLKDLGEPLTKWRVLLRLHYDDDVVSMVTNEFLSSGNIDTNS